MKKTLFLFAALLSMLFYSCTEKFDTGVFSAAQGGSNISGDTVYIPISPVWTGFNNPQDILVGNEPLIYVADTDNDRVVMLNSGGEILGTRRVLKPVALAQDYQLNLYVCGQDTFKIGKKLNGEDSVIMMSAVFKLDLFTSNHQMANAQLKRLLPDRDIVKSLNKNYEYTGVCAFFDNSIYVARKGPNNNSFTDPDNTVLLFERQPDGSHKFIERVPGLEALGTGLRSVNQISSITALKKKNKDFVMTLIADNAFFKTQWLYLNTSSENQKFESRLPNGTAFMLPNRFKKPEGSTLDNKGSIFVADAGADSIYKFNTFGDEMESFGGPNLLKRPSGVAWDDRILYVADAGNNRIIRFTLSTDIR